MHHFLTSNVDKKLGQFVSECDYNDTKAKIQPQDPSSQPSRFIGSGDDNNNEPQWFTTRDGQFASGYHVGKNDRIRLTVDLVNYIPSSQKLFVTLDLEYFPGNVGDDCDITLMTVTGCRKRQIKTSETGAVNTTSDSFLFLKNGTIISTQGHMHDGGSQMELFLNGKPICTSYAKYGGEGATTTIDGKTWETISGMSLCNEKPIPVKVGDALTMTAVYDLQRHPM
jgi:hypothetical protein